MGNYHARFLGGWARATAPGYPPTRKSFSRNGRSAGTYKFLSCPKYGRVKQRIAFQSNESKSMSRAVRPDSWWKSGVEI